MNTLLSAALALCLSAGASQAITYSVDLSFSGARVVGTLETDGTLGDISSANLVTWQFNLFSPVPLLGGVLTDVIEADTFFLNALHEVTATQTELHVDLTADAFVAFSGGAGNGWCIQGTSDGCVRGETSPAIGLYFAENSQVVSAFERLQGSLLLGRVVPEVATVPVPAGLPLLLTALSGLAFARQRRR